MRADQPYLRLDSKWMIWLEDWLVLLPLFAYHLSRYSDPHEAAAFRSFVESSQVWKT